jgi:hypothetical protein
MSFSSWDDAGGNLCWSLLRVKLTKPFNGLWSATGLWGGEGLRVRTCQWALARGFSNRVPRSVALAKRQKTFSVDSRDLGWSDWLTITINTRGRWGTMIRNIAVMQERGSHYPIVRVLPDSWKIDDMMMVHCRWQPQRYND